MDWSLGLESWSVFLEWILGVEPWNAANVLALCILWSGSMEWIIGVDSWSGTLEWNKMYNKCINCMSNTYG